VNLSLFKVEDETFKSALDSRVAFDLSVTAAFDGFLG
jgi:hypothetical protein